jgi:FHS family glucose/mannose:H+ symporter-like MFS transporter
VPLVFTAVIVIGFRDSILGHSVVMSQACDSHSSGRALLFTGFVVTGFVTTVLGPVLPWLTARWSLTDAAAGALFTIQFTGSIVAGALSGLIVARIGSSRTLATGYALMATGLAGLALGNREVGTLAIGVAGVGLGFVVPTTNLLVARLTPEHAAASLGAVNFCWGIGAATWPVVVARFNPAPGVPIALIFVSTLLLLVAARMAAARFPAHALHETASPEAQPAPWRRVTILGLCIALYSGVESAFGGWIAEYTRRLTADVSANTQWETAASAFWGGLAAGRGLVATGLARRFENVALFSGLALVGAAIATLLVVSGAVSGLSPVVAVAVTCGLGLSPSFPVTMAALSREMPPRVAQPMVALGSLGAATVPWLVGAISSRTGSLSNGLSALLVLLAVLVVLHALRVRRIA